MNTESEKQKPRNKSFLKAERVQTDASLNLERGKTDDSLLELRKSSEEDTDEKVKEDRKQADLKRDELRDANDFKNSASKDLTDRRELEDKTVQVERLKVDQAIEQERVKNAKTLDDFLQSERSTTDNNLSHERAQTDIVVLTSTSKLSQEMTLHLQTRTELTTRDQLLAIVSHDLRNPIGSILSCTEILLEDSGNAPSGTELKYWIELIKRNAETSLRLISDILDMERIAEGKLELRRDVQDLSKVIREAVEPFVHVASANRILLRAAVSEQNIPVNLDRDRISQVLSNLIGNALKFTPQGGSVVVSVEKGEGEITVSVSDTGPGISQDQKTKIFKRYSQVGKKDQRGIGLGLYIAKSLVESHNGKIGVHSEVGEGSTFFFSLPI